MTFMKNKHQIKLAGLAGLVLGLLTLLAACQDQSGQTPTPPISAGADGNSPGPTVTAAVSSSPPNRLITATATPTLPPTSPTGPTVAPVTPTPLPLVDTQVNTILNQIRQATQKMVVEAKSFRYRLQQTGELNSGGSLNRFEAVGSGEFQRPAFHQLLTLKVSGQEQQIELYGRENQLFQRVVSLVAWRKWQPAVAGPFPGLVQAQDFKAAGQENLDSLKTTKYSWTFPASQLLPTSGQPEGLGALSATGLYQAFIGDKTSPAQATIWVDDATGFIARYQGTTTFNSGASKLSYSATYDYADFDLASVKVEVPGDLPK